MIPFSVDESEILHGATAILVAALGWYIKLMSAEIAELKGRDAGITKDLADLKVLIAGDYVRRSELKELIEAVFRKLDRIEDKLSNKADKNG